MSGFNNCDMRNNGELDLIRSTVKDGMVVFDVGANVGDWSAAVLAQAKPLLYAFEPHPLIFSEFQKRLPGVQSFNLALSNSIEQKSLYYWGADQSGLSGLYYRPILERLVSRAASTVSVPCTTLEQFCHEHGVEWIDLLKIDTEGSEWDVLQGAGGMLGKIGVIQFEYGGTYQDSGVRLEQVYNLLCKAGYSIARLIPGGELSIEHWSPELENYQYSNYVARLVYNASPQPCGVISIHVREKPS